MTLIVFALRAILAVVLGRTDRLNVLLFFYLVTSQLAASIKALKMFASGEIDREYEAWKR